MRRVGRNRNRNGLLEVVSGKRVFHQRLILVMFCDCPPPKTPFPPPPGRLWTDV